jgi:hypothetical protein
MKQLYWLAFILIYFPGLSVLAQNLEQIGKKEPVKVSGAFAATGTVYDASGIQNRRDPFYWMLSANLNFDIWRLHSVFSYL